MAINITFLINISSKNDFAKCSNFISKVVLHHEITKRECDNILFLQGTENDGEIGSAQWRYKMLREYEAWSLQKESRFRTFKAPEGISKLNERYRITYLMIMDENQLDEISQYKELILLHEGYKRENIYSVIRGRRDLYFKLSQYLSVATKSLNLRDRIYFFNKEEGRMKRLQENPWQAKNYLPLIIVDKENAKRLKQKCVDFLDQNVWLQILNGHISEYKQIQDKIDWKELGGIIRLFLNGINVLKNVPETDVFNVIKDLDVLALALFAYSLENLTDNLSIVDLSEYVDTQRQYADACHQLLENILFHAVSKWGVLSIRMHRSDEQKENGYLVHQYKLQERKNYYEVCICDFAGSSKNQNIAETFINNLAEDDRKGFEAICPENLFKSALGEQDEYAWEWQRYYSDYAHFGKHVGLRIFQRITMDNDGIFIAQSHATHMCGKGEIYCHRASGSEDEYVMPGTAYSILFPIHKTQITAGDRDISQEYGDWITKDPERLLKLDDCVFSKHMHIVRYDSQQEKNDRIADISKVIYDYFKEQEKNILSIDSADIEIHQVELWVKGLMPAAYNLQGERHFVFFHCTEEFIRTFHSAMREMYDTVPCNMFITEKFQIALISNEYEQIVYVPGNIEMTDAINYYYSKIKGIRCPYIFNGNLSENKLESAVGEFIPFDTLTREKDGGDTFFEQYILAVLTKDIQREEFGCQITGTHMRLGSTIHIGQFHEGELLFSSRYCVSRFAFLMLKDMYKEIKEIDNITLYGYASYSETLLVTLQNAISVLKNTKKDKKNTDYIILEREEEHRGMPHADHIRYTINKNGADGKEEKDRAEYMRGRHYIIVVPINSTLKTHQRLIGLLREDNGEIPDEQILRNYALILVGPQSSDYWVKEGKELVCKYGISPNPKFFVSVPAEYEEALKCRFCFPKNTLHEIPLIEVNAASTIPNQSFGIIKGKHLEDKELEVIPDLIDQEKKKLQVLEECMIYGHIRRNDTHFLYYVETEKLVMRAENEILQSLKLWKNNMPTEQKAYHVIVSPSHFSNCRFSEMVNGEVFGGMAMILRIDFNKEYRSNAYVKYSNLRQYIRQISEMDKEAKVIFHYADDNLITGKTYFRAKSVMESIVDQYRNENAGTEVVVFDRIFTLIDRNSPSTRMQYLRKGISIQEVDKYFYCFLHLEISSLRNYGDSCIVCNLHKEARHLHVAAATGIVADYWKNSSDDKFCIKSLTEAVEARIKAEEKDKEETEEFQQRSYRRLVCSHVTKYVLDVVGYDNQTAYAARILLRIMTADYRGWQDKDQAFEYFISYIKTASRPFLVYVKAVKEAIYDILLIVIEQIIKDKTIADIIKECGEKEYWSKIESELTEFEELILKQLTWMQKRDVVLVIMKQLTEMKSNYIIRLENMNALFDFHKKIIDELLIRDECKEIEKLKKRLFKNKGESVETKEKIAEKEGEDFWTRYIILIKKLTGISSDTSKSLWLDYALLYRKELVHNREIPVTQNMSDMFRQIIILENTAAFQDGIRKIYQQIRRDEKFWNNQILPLLGMICEIERNTVIAAGYFDWWRNQYSREAEKRNAWETMDELLRHLSESAYFSPAKAEEAYENIERRNGILELAFRQLHDYVSDKTVSTYDVLRDKLEESTEGYQFSNFLYLMTMMKWYNDGEKFTQTGIVQIAGCLLMKYLFEETADNERPLLKTIEDLVKVIGWLLGDIPVKMWVEYPDSSEYYKEVIREKFIEKMSRCKPEIKKEKIEERANSLLFKSMKHFHIIGDNVGHIAALDEEEQQRLNWDDVYGKLEKYGYYYDRDDFIWKIGRKSKYPIYLSAKFVRNKEDGDEDDTLYRIRNLLSLTSDVEDYLEGKQNYFHETELAKSRLNVLERDRSISHTKEKMRRENFKKIVKGQDPKKDNTLVLLADLNVSRMYRQSLNKSFYDELNEPEGMRWKDENNLLLRNEIVEELHGNSTTIGILNSSVLTGDHPLKEDDEFIVLKEREQELMSLLLAMILNVKEKGRGKEGDGKFCVYISKSENGILHIASETDCEESALKSVRACLEQEPFSEESGITLWTLNSYLKKVKSAWAKLILEKMHGDNIDQIIALLNHLTDETFQINVTIKEENDKRYFLYELPVLRQQYLKLLESNGTYKE